MLLGSVRVKTVRRTLIKLSPGYVLTAAHCLVLKPPNKLKTVIVVFGQHDSRVPGESEFKVSQIINHPDYNRSRTGKT